MGSHLDHVHLKNIFCFIPHKLQDTKKYIWLNRAWRITDERWEYYLGLLPEITYYKDKPEIK